MLRILFVDDEENVLNGLKRMLHSMREEWEMTFVPGGVEALQFLESSDVDVVVSDMKMPGMDGAELLRRVRDLYPQTVRMVLSGFADSEMIMKSVAEAHQYMSKPCDAESLKQTIQRACSLHALLNDERLRLCVTQLTSIPSIPTLYTELMEEIEKDSPSIKIISAIIEKDIGMTVKILQIVNSAFFALRRNISDANEAVRLLGLDTISSLALALGVFSKFENSDIDKQEIQGIWRHSMTVGTIARKIATAEERSLSNDAFTAGLLHDVGRLVLAQNLPNEFQAILSESTSKGITIQEAELALIGTTHAEIGAYLLSLWGLPRSIVESTAFHHNPGIYQANEFSCLTAVHAANAIQSSNGDSESFENILDSGYIAGIGLSGRVDSWWQEYEKLVDCETAD